MLLGLGDRANERTRLVYGISVTEEQPFPCCDLRARGHGVVLACPVFGEWWGGDEGQLWAGGGDGPSVVRMIIWAGEGTLPYVSS